MALTNEQKTPIYLILLALALGYIGYSGEVLRYAGLPGVTQLGDTVAARQKTIDSLEAQTDSARKLLAQGSVEDLRRRLDGYRASLELMRRLVPDRNEVANLMDEISTRAKIRGVQVSQFMPLAPAPGPVPFETYRYQYSVYGKYDQIGEFLSDVASLQRIIVPIDLQLVAAPELSARALGDSSGSLLEAKFQVRTYVKTSSPEGGSSGS